MNGERRIHQHNAARQRIEHALQLLLVALGLELRGDTHGLSGLADRTLQDVVDTKLIWLDNKFLELFETEPSLTRRGKIGKAFQQAEFNMTKIG